MEKCYVCEEEPQFESCARCGAEPHLEEWRKMKEALLLFVTYANNSQKDILGYVEEVDSCDLEDVTDNLHSALSEIKEKLPKILAEKLVVPRAGNFPEPDDELPVYAIAEQANKLRVLRAVYDFAVANKYGLEESFKSAVVPNSDNNAVLVWLEMQRREDEDLFDTAKRLL